MPDTASNDSLIQLANSLLLSKKNSLLVMQGIWLETFEIAHVSVRKISTKGWVR